MFHRIKKALGTRARSRKQQADTYDLAEKPFTKALLLRESEAQDEAIRDMRRQVERAIPMVQDKTFEELAATCAVTLAFHNYP